MVGPSNLAKGAIDWQSVGARSASVGSSVAARLEELVRRGDLPDGSRLPAERELAQLLAVSRTSVREAIRELWLKGLVDRRQGRATYVIAGGPDRNAFLSRLYDRLDTQDLTVLQVMDYRAALEPAIAARAAERATQRDDERLEQILAEMQVVSSGRRAAELDASFHYAVAQATQNPLLGEVVEFSSSWLEMTRQEALQGSRRRAVSMASHRALLRAIVARDPGAAAAAMAQHVREVSSYVEARLSASRRMETARGHEAGRASSTGQRGKPTRLAERR